MSVSLRPGDEILIATDRDEFRGTFVEVTWDDRDGLLLAFYPIPRENPYFRHAVQASAITRIELLRPALT